MQHFQTILIAIGFLAIAGVLAHGFLLSRKKKLALRTEQEENETHELEELVDDTTGIDNIAVERNIDGMDFSTAVIDDNEIANGVKFVVDEIEEEVEPAILLDDEKLDGADKIETEKLDVEKVETDIVVEDTPNEIIDESEIITESSLTENKSEEPKSDNNTPTDIFVFNVVKRENSRLGGHELLQFFLTSGFRFGAMNIFHRHENSDGTGEVLFSIANMMAPGTFDLDLMEQFNSQGISFFLTAPNSKISIKKSFDLMLRAVEQLADEFDCDVLNADREPLTERQFIEYRNKLQQYP